MDASKAMDTDQGAAIVTADPSNPSTVLDLNPTAFVDDLYNAVELHLATGFEGLDIALRNELKSVSTPEQQVTLLQGTAGVYQDLKEEMKNRMQTFEQYALAEILKVPPGLLADPITNDATDIEDVTEEEEAAVDAELLALQREIAAGKRLGRETHAAISKLDHLIQSLTNDVSKLEAIPNVLASKENLIDDLRTVVKKGAAVEATCAKVNALQQNLSTTTTTTTPAGKSNTTAQDGDTTIPLAVALQQQQNAESLSDVAIEREILKRAMGAKNAPAEDLAAIRESLGIQ